MHETTHIKGKDTSLEASIESMYQKLAAIEIEIEEVSVLNPVPYVYSQHIRDKHCEVLFTNGKGSTKKACLASSLGEYFERLGCNYFFSDYYLGSQIAQGDFVHYPNEKWFTFDDESMPEGILDDTLWAFYDIDTQLQPSEIFETNSGAGERGICTLPFTRVRDGVDIFFPVNFISNLYVSNGMAAGNTAEEAQVQALCEIYERYVKNKIISEALCLPLIPQEVIHAYPQIQTSILKLEEKGYSLRVCDASLGGVYPVISVTLINPKDGSVLASFGAHPCFEVALERTVTELLQGRTLDTLNDFHAPSFHLDEVADPNNLEAHFINATGLISYEFFKQSYDYDYVAWDSTTNTQNERNAMLNIAKKQGFEVYLAEYSHLGMYTCRILIPGMSEIYPVDDLLWNNNNQGAYFREAILSLKHLSDEEIEVILENIKEAELSDMLKVAEFIGIIPDTNTPWQNLQIGELKAMFYLALGAYEEAQIWVSWCMHIASLDTQRANLYTCLYALLTIQVENKNLETYKSSLTQMYGANTLNTAIDIVAKKVKFHGLHVAGLKLEGFHTHQQVLQAYEKVQVAKRAL